GLHLTPTGKKLQREAQATATSLEQGATHALTPAELKTLIQLLKKVYRG
ncbi:MAG: MarR family transcriptional regulator, partial [Comamonadaceae bacterium]|nr:MarR family transcriptional regulator [Comamonadaceae bacterium]